MGMCIYLTGQRFGRLTVIRRAETKNIAACWLCECDCGNRITVVGSSLRNGNTKSCGCLQREAVTKHATKHGWYGTRLYRIWGGMKRRCYSPKAEMYDNYGGCGITVCDEWRNSFEDFRDWALANGYDDTLTIDRIDVNGNYCPENCRWATKIEQANNMSTNKFITFNGETHTQEQWARICGFKDGRIIHKRLKRGWSIEKALTEPVKKEHR